MNPVSFVQATHGTLRYTIVATDYTTEVELHALCGVPADAIDCGQINAAITTNTALEFGQLLFGWDEVPPHGVSITVHSSFHVLCIRNLFISDGFTLTKRLIPD